MNDIRQRVIRLEWVKGADLIPNPKNWRRHPESQRQALRALVRQIGFAGAELVRETPEGLMLIDGHLRSEEFKETRLPVLVTDLTDEEADLILASYDPLGAMAEADAGALNELISLVQTDDAAILALLESLEAPYTPASEDDWQTAFGDLPDGDRPPFQQMTFTLHDEQAETVKRAITTAKALGPFGDTGNENSNGNALARICEWFEGQHGQR